jgi:hypothetical protein
MAAPNNPFNNIDPPDDPSKYSINSFDDVKLYLKRFYNHTYLMWQRTGGSESSLPSLEGLKASVYELNTLVGINTLTSVQIQLNEKVSSSSLGNMAFQNASSVSITGGNIVNVSYTNGLIDDSTIANSTVSVKQGASGENALVGGRIFYSTTPVPNDSNNYGNLIEYWLPANSLSSDGSHLEISGWGEFASNANNKQLLVYFGSTLLLDTGTVAANGGSWLVNVKIIRSSSNSQQAITSIISDNTLVVPQANYVTCSESVTSNISIRCAALGVVTYDITQMGMTVKWFR